MTNVIGLMKTIAEAAGRFSFRGELKPNAVKNRSKHAIKKKRKSRASNRMARESRRKNRSK